MAKLDRQPVVRACVIDRKHAASGHHALREPTRTRGLHAQMATVCEPQGVNGAGRTGPP
jgi:hypothetical protein